MASEISSYTYPSVYAAQGDSGNTYVGFKQFYESDGDYFDFGGATGDYIQIQEHPQTDPYTRPLIVHLQDLSNDLAVTLEYFCEITQTVPAEYHVTGNIVTKRKSTGETIDTFEYGNHYYRGSDSINMSMPYMYGAPVIKYYPSYTSYVENPTESTKKTSRTINNK